MKKEIERRRKELESIRRAIERHENSQESLISEAAKLESMAESGRISFYEYDALGRRRSEAGRKAKSCRMLLNQLKLAEHDAITALEWARRAYYSSIQGESRAPYAVFTIFLLAASAAMFALLRGGITGHAAGSDVTAPDYLIFTISAGLVAAVFFMLVKFAFRSENI